MPEFELVLCDSPYGRRCVESTCGFPGLELGEGELGPAPFDDAASKYCSGLALTFVAAVKNVLRSAGPAAVEDEGELTLEAE